MGFSTPKTPFNLADFLSEKGQPRPKRRQTWTNPRAASGSVPASDAPEAGGAPPAAAGAQKKPRKTPRE